MKTCTKCGETKGLADFYVRKSGVVAARCKVCVREDRTAYRLANPEKVKDSLRRSHEKHRDQRLAKQREWHHSNPEKVRAKKVRQKAEDPSAASRRSAKWRMENPERDRANRRRWYENNRDRAAELGRLSRERMAPGEKAAQLKAWRDANPEAHLAIVHRRRALKRAANVGDVTAQAIRDLFAQYDNVCAYCDREATTLDHHMPLKLGGLHSIENLRPACKTCNSSKGAKHPEVWLSTR